MKGKKGLDWLDHRRTFLGRHSQWRTVHSLINIDATFPPLLWLKCVVIHNYLHKFQLELHVALPTKTQETKNKNKLIVTPRDEPACSDFTKHSIWTKWSFWRKIINDTSTQKLSSVICSLNITLSKIKTLLKVLSRKSSMFCRLWQ